MSRRVLPLRFFARDATRVAPELIGKVFVRRFPGGKLRRFRIIETEAYLQDDPACHAFRGKTPRNQAMFGPAGRAYVYFIYGMHYCLNIVTGSTGDGQAVLLRALLPLGAEVSASSTSGPGKLCRALQIDRSQDHEPFRRGGEFWIEDDGTELRARRTRRIGITQAKSKLWRWHAGSIPKTKTQP